MFIMKNIHQIRPSRIVMRVFSTKSMDKIKSQLKRCRVLKVMNKLESLFKWQIMTAEYVEEQFSFMGKEKCSSKATATLATLVTVLGSCTKQCFRKSVVSPMSNHDFG